MPHGAEISTYITGSSGKCCFVWLIHSWSIWEHGAAVSFFASARSSRSGGKNDASQRESMIALVRNMILLVKQASHHPKYHKAFSGEEFPETNPLTQDTSPVFKVEYHISSVNIVLYRLNKPPQHHGKKPPRIPINFQRSHLQREFSHKNTSCKVGPHS